MSAAGGRLLIDCPDRRGIVAAVSSLLADHRANIVEVDQHSTGEPESRLFMRVAFESAAGGPALAQLGEAFARDVARPFAMTWRLVDARDRPRVAILVSREGHCLDELLNRQRSGELAADIAMVISNHDVHRARVQALGIDYHHVATPPGSRSDLGVLARYMQVLSADFLAAVAIPFINIHHSFLPAFLGARPYHQAHDRGVKIVGATAHYVTEELDAGPIIEQDVVRVDHRAQVVDLARLGADVERSVLVRAVRWHLDDRVLVHGARTVVFERR
jgi:formyltetrahydrofolate deformylase